MPDWNWDGTKNKRNLAKHGIDFDTAQLVFDDPFAVTRFDMNCEDEDRWQTLGMIGPALVIVVHTVPDLNTAGRIISARKATRHERRAYEEGEF